VSVRNEKQEPMKSVSPQCC